MLETAQSIPLQYLFSFSQSARAYLAGSIFQLQDIVRGGFYIIGC
jgi:hypothetical protein